jgi:hypothetical protein
MRASLLFRTREQRSFLLPGRDGNCDVERIAGLGIGRPDSDQVRIGDQPQDR